MSTVRARGFTLVELVVVIAIAGLLFQIVTANLGAMIPSHALDSACAQIVGQLDFLRSEARLQGKTYQLELDLDHNRYRSVLPPEDLALAEERSGQTFDLGWTELGERVRLLSCAVAGGPEFRNGTFPIAFDANGFTADQTIHLVHTTDPKMLWTIQLRGLTGQAEIIPDTSGQPHPLEKVDEGSF
jgi:prepilin-type N-terminal cleavage/methylation domain-containing protein